MESGPDYGIGNLCPGFRSRPILPKIQDVGLVQTQKLTTRAVVDSRIMSMGTNMSQEYIESLRARNDAVWAERRSWFLGFYFGTGDDRLWAPRRIANGEQHPDKRIVNFAHPMGKQAAQILMLAYFIGTLAAIIVTAMFLGYSW